MEVIVSGNDDVSDGADSSVLFRDGDERDEDYILLHIGNCEKEDRDDSVWGMVLQRVTGPNSVVMV